MACLFACFSVSKHKKRRFFIKANSSSDPMHEAERALLQATKAENQAHAEKPSKIVSITREKHDEQVKCSAEKKDLSDLVSETHEELPVKAISDELIEQNGEKEDEKSNEGQKGNQLVTEPSHMSQKNCLRIRDGFEDVALKGLKEADDTVGGKEFSFVIEESSESLFSLSIESRKRVCEVEFGGEKEVTSPITTKEIIQPTTETKVMENSNQNAQGQPAELMLNPIQNIADWKFVEVKNEKTPEDKEKENIHITAEEEEEEEEETLRQERILNKSSKIEAVGQEMTVETSLSSWLVESERTKSLSKSNSVNSVAILDSKIRNSPSSYEDRSVLKERNRKEQKEEVVSVCKSSTRGKSSDDVPPIGTIGSYWSCTKQTQKRIAAI